MAGVKRIVACIIYCLTQKLVGIGVDRGDGGNQPSVFQFTTVAREIKLPYVTCSLICEAFVHTRQKTTGGTNRVVWISSGTCNQRAGNKQNLGDKWVAVHVMDSWGSIRHTGISSQHKIILSWTHAFLPHRISEPGFSRVQTTPGRLQAAGVASVRLRYGCRDVLGGPIAKDLMPSRLSECGTEVNFMKRRCFFVPSIHMLEPCAFNSPRCTGRRWACGEGFLLFFQVLQFGVNNNSEEQLWKIEVAQPPGGHSKYRRMTNGADDTAEAEVVA